MLSQGSPNRRRSSGALVATALVTLCAHVSSDTGRNFRHNLIQASFPQQFYRTSALQQARGLVTAVATTTYSLPQLAYVSVQPTACVFFHIAQLTHGDLRWNFTRHIRLSARLTLRQFGKGNFMLKTHCFGKLPRTRVMYLRPS